MAKHTNIAIKKLDYTKDDLQSFCDQWKITELSVFGSAARDDFDPEKSDIDLLVTFADEAKWGLLDQVEMENELEEIFHQEVDLVDRKAIAKSNNWIRRDAILKENKIIYAAR